MTVTQLSKKLDDILFSVAVIQEFVGFVKKQRQLFGGKFLRCGNYPVAHYIYIGSFHNLYFAQPLVQEIKLGQRLINSCKIMIESSAALVDEAGAA